MSGAGAVWREPVSPPATVEVGQVFRDVDERWCVRYGTRRRLKVDRVLETVAICSDVGEEPRVSYKLTFPIEQLVDEDRFARCPELEEESTNETERTA